MATKKGFKISAGEGRLPGHILLKGVNSNLLNVKVSASDTNGELAILSRLRYTGKLKRSLRCRSRIVSLFQAYA